MLCIRPRDTSLSHPDSNWRRGDDCSGSYPPLHTTFLFPLKKNPQKLKKTPNTEMPAPEEQQEKWETEANDNCSHDEINHV